MADRAMRRPSSKKLPTCSRWENTAFRQGDNIAGRQAFSVALQVDRKHTGSGSVRQCTQHSDPPVCLDNGSGRLALLFNLHWTATLTTLVTTQAHKLSPGLRRFHGP